MSTEYSDPNVDLEQERANYVAALKHAFLTLGEDAFWDEIGGRFGDFGDDNCGQLIIYTNYFPDGEVCEDE